MAEAVQITTQLTLWFSALGGIVCLRYYLRTKPSPQRNFRLFAAFILFYFGAIYLIALSGEYIGDSAVYYLVRAGILTRMGVLALIGLLTGWVISENGLK